MRKNLHDKILKEELKEQHINNVPKSCSFFNINPNLPPSQEEK